MRDSIKEIIKSNFVMNKVYILQALFHEEKSLYTAFLCSYNSSK